MNEELKKLIGAKLKRILNIQTRAVKDENGEVIEGVLDFIVATNSIDRHDEVLSIKGIDLKNYKKNPVVLFGHKYDEPPIGRAIDIKKEVDGDKEQLVARVQFAIDIYPFANLIYQMYLGNYMSATSIGFIPSEVKFLDENADDTIIFSKSEMLEFSAVPVPANPEALALAVKCGFDESKLKAIEEGKGHIDKSIDDDDDDDLEDGEIEVPISMLNLKEGKVLSEKNKSLIIKTIEGLNASASMLQEILDKADKDKTIDGNGKGDDDDDLKDAKQIVDNINKNTSAVGDLLSQAGASKNSKGRKAKKVLLIKAKKLAVLNDKATEMLISELKNII